MLENAVGERGFSVIDVSYDAKIAAIDVTPEELGKAIGKVGAVAAVCTTDRGFAEAILKILNSNI